MNDSLITADASTHIKILVVSLLAAIIVIWIGISARSMPAGNFAADPRVERTDGDAGMLTRDRAALDRRPAALDVL